MKIFNWDFILSFIGVLFAYSLIPTIRQSIKENKVQFPLQTILITFLGMFITEIFYFQSHMYWTFFTGGITTICWFILLFLKVKRKIEK